MTTWFAAFENCAFGLHKNATYVLRVYNLKKPGTIKIRTRIGSIFWLMNMKYKKVNSHIKTRREM